MSKPRQYMVTYTTGVQITEDSFTTIHPTLAVTDETTVKEIRDWYSKAGRLEFMDVTLVEAAKLP